MSDSAVSKRTPEDTRTASELRTLLGEQLGWLRTSARAFDAGDISEAKRMAVIVRTLVHTENGSVGILTQLGSRDSTSWVSMIDMQVPVANRPGLWVYDEHVAGYALRNFASPFRADFKTWWESPVEESDDAKMNRKSFVLALANIGGGAHVDPSRTRVRERLDHLAGLHPNRINSAGKSYPDSTNPLPFALRTIATEVGHTLET